MTNAVTLASLANSGYLRNRIINGAMQIDQRNAGAAVTPSASSGNNYSLDRWSYVPTQGSKFTFQQVATTALDGFQNYLSATVASAVTVGASDNFSIRQYIEGYNFSDLNFGTANAKTVTLSFWVRSSLTGSFGGSFTNYAGTRSYPFSYTINSANTWEYKTITMPGDTGGTWVGATNAGAAIVHFGLGCGSTYTGAAGSWTSNYYIQPTGTVSVIGTAGATWFITGVQLEVGTQATPFEWRPYPVEFSMCQRYYEQDDVAMDGTPKISTGGLVQTSTYFTYGFKVTKRTTPTCTVTQVNNIDNSSGALSVQQVSSGAMRVAIGIANTSFYYSVANIRYTSSAEL